MYSQFGEDDIVIKYFNDNYGVDYKGNLLDIGANDGIFLSNSRALLEKGWCGDLVEPAAIPFRKLKKVYNENNNVRLHEFAISAENGTTMFYESSSFYTQADSGLLSTIVEEEKKKFMTYGMRYSQYEIETLTFDSFKEKAFCPEWHFISCDTEGTDYAILEQIDLKAVNCKCLCIEHNGIEIEKYIKHAEKFGLKELFRNYVNIILTI
jgi:FkbM family methyltransferase